jgi:hypothetical protein
LIAIVQRLFATPEAVSETKKPLNLAVQRLTDFLVVMGGLEPSTYGL